MVFFENNAIVNADESAARREQSSIRKAGSTIANRSTPGFHPAANPHGRVTSAHVSEILRDAPCAIESFG
jgi:hypothetical protein